MSVRVRACCRQAVQAFVALVDVRYDEAFQCPACRHLEHREMCLCLDGIVQGLSASLMHATLKLPSQGATEDM